MAVQEIVKLFKQFLTLLEQNPLIFGTNLDGTYTAMPPERM